MRVFWTKGYEWSSLEDVCKASGINRSTLYASFGDKRTLLRLTLARYTQQGTARLAAILSPKRPIREAIAELLQATIDSIVSGPGRSGCFIGNCAAELARHDRAAMGDVKDSLQRIESILHAALQGAQSRGELLPGVDVTALARYFMSGLQGLRLVGKANPDRKTLEDIATTMLRVLD